MTCRFPYFDSSAVRCSALRLAALSALSLSAAGCVAIEASLFVPVGGDRIARFFHRASALDDGTVMVTGGLGVQFVPLSLLTLDAVTLFDSRTNSFRYAHAPNGVIARLLTPRSSHTQTTLLDGRVLITGGRTGAAGTDTGTTLNSAELYDPATGAFMNGPPMSTRRADHTASRLKDGRVVIAGGASWQVLGPAAGAWSEDTSLHRRRSSHAAVVIVDWGGVVGDDRVLLIGGTGTGSDTLELLNPGTMSSIIMSSTLTSGVDDLAAGKLPNGRILIVGGQTSSGDTTNRSYLYEAVNDVIVDAPAPPEREGGIADHQLVVLGDFACIFGGEQQASGRDTELDYFAVFDSTIDQWVAHGSMRSAHDDFVAVPISASRILLVGGGVSILENEAPSPNAEVFDLTNTINSLLPPS